MSVVGMWVKYIKGTGIRKGKGKGKGYYFKKGGGLNG